MNGGKDNPSVKGIDGGCENGISEIMNKITRRKKNVLSPIFPTSLCTFRHRLVTISTHLSVPSSSRLPSRDRVRLRKIARP